MKKVITGLAMGLLMFMMFGIAHAAPYSFYLEGDIYRVVDDYGILNTDPHVSLRPYIYGRPTYVQYKVTADPALNADPMWFPYSGKNLSLVDGPGSNPNFNYDFMHGEIDAFPYLGKTEKGYTEINSPEHWAYNYAYASLLTNGSLNYSDLSFYSGNSDDFVQISFTKSTAPLLTLDEIGIGSIAHAVEMVIDPLGRRVEVDSWLRVVRVDKPSQVPEPSAMLLLGSGLLGLVVLNRRRKA